MPVTLEQFGPDMPEPGESLLTDTQRTELRRRMAEDDADPDGGISWEEVKAKARLRMG
jgi:putative addiction module component (TIGR02574 family)